METHYDCICRAGGIVCSIFILIGTGIRCLQWLFLDHPDAGFIFKILAHAGIVTVT